MYAQLVPLGHGERSGPPRRAELWGLTVLRAGFPTRGGGLFRRRERALRRTAARLREQGVRHALAPRDFPWWPLLEEAGLSPVETAGLCQAVAAPLTMEALALRGWEPGRAVVALAGEHVTLPLARCAERLAGQVRGLIVQVPRDGETLAARLQRDWGLPVWVPGAARPALTVAFDGSWRGSGPALRLYGPAPELLGAEVWAEGVEPGPDWEPMPLLAALWEGGALPGGALRVRPAQMGLDIWGKPPYN